MAPMNIVFIASEAAPLAKTGGLADVAGSLPLALSRLGHRVTVILPYYRKQIGASGAPVNAMNKAVTIWVDGVNRTAPLHKAVVEGVDFILVEQDDLFARDGIYGPAGGAWEDNFPRYLFFSRAALETSCMLGAPVDILHCHDWQTGFIPLLAKTQYQHRTHLAKAKSVFTIHNLAYQGCFPSFWLHRLGLPADYYHTGCYEFYSQINCMKAGIAAADHVTTVSKTYAEEILTPEYGCALNGFLGDHKNKLSGIVNGLDIENWDPSGDSAIAAPFGPGKLAGKAACKAALQAETGLSSDSEQPMLTMISRLAEQKGVDLLLDCIPGWLQEGYQIAILGSGEPAWEAALHRLAAERPQQMYFHAGFDEGLARRIYAAGDIFLMPSRFEPCGLGQLMAMRYANIPVVRATGGLKDTVTDYAQDRNNATGFAFTEPNPDAFRAALDSAVETWRKPIVWKHVMGNAIKRDSSWDASANSYLELYASLND
ncbi:MAG: glycogen synthase GlgA [Zetaproteobacteria bacterium CG06_land_8_20_14_3_00_59_53]|nr:MAG: glycogen synthase GlgA [Zetaproteobacteria bacterium CG23_combo_of_CG06-09_8_20_14_all_59_86]PIQ65650.1 MAG: glycogen synthase GlgA [Zetaproteobacteria bacterium CG11_big_fil_rev_8_21_14_0_20_59_439]PIU70667.1 MAG: glycogen synthase GlgA [Zetaproteobacteria bacterium CG06_land_8_20_14_3_00_59_53]PIU98064.1 MAG: glycogen synthase GlgA [Zetaproteobacteria bacterium CG03_land_8_20_14_0_80_59_51]PIY47900.1 MAG: glycogen synthase GlgA [Zetaproteobacteria bacterium CG_4_10_14_0_8_um_filter_59